MIFDFAFCLRGRTLRAVKMTSPTLSTWAASGLPVGLQIVGRPFDDATVLRVGHAYEQATDWHRRKPALEAAPR